MAGKAVIRKVLGATVVFCIMAVFIPLMVQAAVPEEEQLAGITMDKAALWSPGKLTVGADGTLYVVDSYKNHVLKFDRDGKYLGDISFPRVSAIAVTPNGTMYIGSHQNYAVSIIKNGQVVGYLGAATNEFRSIRDIAYDASTGNIFVVDNVGNAVRVFNAAGQDLGSIAGVNLPVGIEITADAIYVIDAPVVREQNTNTTSSRISIFDKSFNHIRFFDDYAMNEAEQTKMLRPTDITVSDGIVYVTDAALNSVLLFDEKGIFLKEIQDIAGGLRAAVSLALSADNILYVSSSETHSIRMFAITPIPAAQQGGQQ